LVGGNRAPLNSAGPARVLVCWPKRGFRLFDFWCIIDFFRDSIEVRDLRFLYQGVDFCLFDFCDFCLRDALQRPDPAGPSAHKSYSKSHRFIFRLFFLLSLGFSQTRISLWPKIGNVYLRLGVVPLIPPWSQVVELLLEIF